MKRNNLGDKGYHTAIIITTIVLTIISFFTNLTAKHHLIGGLSILGITFIITSIQYVLTNEIIILKQYNFGFVFGILTILFSFYGFLVLSNSLFNFNSTHWFTYILTLSTYLILNKLFDDNEK